MTGVMGMARTSERVGLTAHSAIYIFLQQDIDNIFNIIAYLPQKCWLLIHDCCFTNQMLESVRE